MISELGFRNRGVKEGTGLYVVHKTYAKSMLVECCFVDSEDTKKYLDVGTYDIADAIAKALYNNISRITRNKKRDEDVKKIVTYKGDIDALAAILVAQKHNCALMKEDDYLESGIKANEVIKVGGGEEDKNRYESFKNAAKLI